MASFSYDPKTVYGDDAMDATAERMRVGEAGELIFDNYKMAGRTASYVPSLIIAPGEWKAAWSND